jgi:hypothetical protein
MLVSIELWEQAFWMLPSIVYCITTGFNVLDVLLRHLPQVKLSQVLRESNMRLRRWLTALLVCLLSLSAWAESKGNARKFVASLANGTTVELVAVTMNDPGRDTSKPRPWWRPDGTLLPAGLYDYAGIMTTDSHARQFTLRIQADTDYSCMTFNALGRTSVEPTVPFDAQKQTLPHLRVFIGEIEGDASSDTIRVGLSVGPWQTVEQWQNSDWHKHDPDDIILGTSKNPLILFWPRSKRGAVILEMVDAYTDQALRMKVTDRDGHTFYESPRTFGQGKGLARHQYWFWDIKLEDLRTVTLQTRRFQWVEFQNVSLQPNALTNVQTVTLPVMPDDTNSVPSDVETCLGSLLDRLARNVKLPARGHAEYDVREGNRIIECDYLFDGSRYRFHPKQVEGEGSLNVVTLFDGYRSVMWEPGHDYAQNIRSERMSGIVYKLDQYCPTGFIDQLNTHDVRPLADESIGSTPCKVLKIVISSKDAVKWWIATEPDVFPRRIERYEHDCLRYRYEAENLCMWSNGVVFPRTLGIAYYRRGNDDKPVLISKKEITIRSFSPWLYVTPKMLGRDLPEGILAQLPELQASSHSLKGRPIAITKIPGSGELLEKGRPVIMCFVDIGQRPSRHHLQQLKQLASRLQEKGLTLVAVQVSAVETQQLEQWIQDQGIPFAILQAPGNFEQQRLDWGIKSLPWMVLTDADHFVLREGLTLDAIQKL